MSKSFVSMYATVLLTACLASGPAAAEATQPLSTAQSGVDLSRIAIDNFGQLNAHFYRGGQPLRGDYADLASLGVKTVIDLQADGQLEEERLVRDAGMAFHRIPMTTHVAPTDQQIAEFLGLVSDPAAQPVYVHCAGGRHRTGVMSAIYRMTADGWTADQAFSEMKHYKFGMDFLHPEFKSFVYAYDGQLHHAAAPSRVVAAMH
jgi:protein tyrosine/serine phosphatase